MKLVIDASVNLKWILGAEEPDAGRAEALLAAIAAGEHRIFQPPHWFAEVLSVLASKRTHRIEETFNILQAIPHELCTNIQIYRDAARLSVQLKHHLFDTLYHAVAKEHGAALITADDAYFAKAYRLGNIKLLTNFI